MTRWRTSSARGIEVALVTGRSFHFTRPIAELLPIPLTLIVNNGARRERTRPASTALRHLLPRDAAPRSFWPRPAPTRTASPIVSSIRARRAADCLRSDGLVASAAAAATTRRTGRSSRPRRAPLVEVADRGSDSGDVQRRRRCRCASSRIRAAVLPAADQYCRRDHRVRSARLRARRRQRRRLARRGTTLARWASRARGIARDQIMAVGDNLNDVEMLDFAGVAVVMGNAADATQVARLSPDRQQRRSRPRQRDQRLRLKRTMSAARSSGSGASKRSARRSAGCANARRCACSACRGTTIARRGVVRPSRSAARRRADARAARLHPDLILAARHQRHILNQRRAGQPLDDAIPADRFLRRVGSTRVRPASA